MNKRISLEDAFMRHAEIAALRSTCPARNVGAVIVSEDGYLLTTGYNGAPRGMIHCTEAGCDPDLHGRCTRAVHAEMNAILQAARRGIAIQGAVLYCTTRPCLNCAKAIIQAGISRIYFKEDDLQSFQRPAVLKLLITAGIPFHHTEEPHITIHYQANVV